MTSGRNANVVPAHDCRTSARSAGVREIAGALTGSASGDLTSKLAGIAVSVMAARSLAEGFATYVGLLAVAHLGAAAWDAGVSTLASVERSGLRT